MDNLSRFNLSRRDVACFCIPDSMDAEEDGVTLVLVTNEGRFVEISGQTVSDKLAFNFPTVGARMISIFYSYEPKFKFYLIAFNDVLVVLKKEKKLVLAKKMSNVKEFSIKDSLRLGKPQVVVSFLGKTQPLVTDFLDGFKNPNDRRITGIGLAFASEMNGIRIRTKRLEKLLGDKKSLISRMTTPLILNAPSFHVHHDNLVFALGSSTHNYQGSNNFLKVEKGLVKAFNKCWIISFHIQNNHKESISNLEMYIADQKVVVKKSYLYTHTSDKFNYTRSSFLSPSKTGYFVGVIKEPFFTQSTINLTTIVKFKTGSKMYQYYLEDVNIQMQNMVEGKYKLYRQGITIEDVLAIRSLSYEIKLHSKGVTSEEVGQALTNGLKFKRLSSCYYLNNTSSYFNDCLVVSIADGYSFYTSDQNQFVVLFQSLKQLLGDVYFTDLFVNSKLANQVMQDELLFLKQILFEQLNASEDDKRSNTDCVLKKLAKLEMETVKAFKHM